MLRFLESADRGQLNRRELLRVGGLGTLGFSLADLLRSSARGARSSEVEQSFGKAKNILFLFLSGGPSQYETFDPKPDAPAEIRGIFKPIATNVPGVPLMVAWMTGSGSAVTNGTSASGPAIVARRVASLRRRCSSPSSRSAAVSVSNACIAPPLAGW